MLVIVYEGYLIHLILAIPNVTTYSFSLAVPLSCFHRMYMQYRQTDTILLEIHLHKALDLPSATVLILHFSLVSWTRYS